MNIDEYSQLVMTGVSWKHVLTALGGFNGYSGGTDQILAALMAAPDTRERQDLAIIARNVVLVADHSVGERYIRFADGDVGAPYIADEDFNGRWKVAIPEMAEEIEFSSATSGSTIRADKERDGSWTITGIFPILDGERYEGSYFRAFMAAAAIPMAGAEQQLELERLMGVEDIARQQLYDALEGSPIVEMDSFQGWDLLERSYASEAEVAETTAFLTNRGWEATRATVYGYGDPVNVLAARPASGNDGEAELEKLAGYGWLEYPYGPQRWFDTRLLTIR